MVPTNDEFMTTKGKTRHSFPHSLSLADQRQTFSVAFYFVRTACTESSTGSLVGIQWRKGT
jgi:hypothetical protein